MPLKAKTLVTTATVSDSPATGIEQLTDVLVVLDHIQGRIQDYLDGNGKDAGNIMGIVMSEGLSVAPKIRAAVEGFDQIKSELKDLDFSEFQTLNRTYLERPTYEILKAGLDKVLD